MMIDSGEPSVGGISKRDYGRKQRGGPWESGPNGLTSQGGVMATPSQLAGS